MSANIKSSGGSRGAKANGVELQIYNKWSQSSGASFYSPGPLLGGTANLQRGEGATGTERPTRFRFCLGGNDERNAVHLSSTNRERCRYTDLCSGETNFHALLVPAPEKPSIARQIRRCSVFVGLEGVNNPPPALSRYGAAITPRPAGSGKLVSDDFPVFHWRHYARIS